MTWKCKKHKASSEESVTFQEECDGCYTADMLNAILRQERMKLVEWMKE